MLLYYDENIYINKLQKQYRYSKPFNILLIISLNCIFIACLVINLIFFSSPLVYWALRTIPFHNQASIFLCQTLYPFLWHLPSTFLSTYHPWLDHKFSAKLFFQKLIFCPFSWVAKFQNHTILLVVSGIYIGNYFFSIPDMTHEFSNFISS